MLANACFGTRTEAQLIRAAGNMNLIMPENSVQEAWYPPVTGPDVDQQGTCREA